MNSFARATPWLHDAARGYATYGVVLIAALWAPVGVLIAVGLNQPLGNAVHEARPYTSLRDIEVLVARSSDFSFPSDHAVMAGAAVAGVWSVSRRVGLLTATSSSAASWNPS